MKLAEIEQEKSRLAKLVFEGADVRIKYAFKNDIGNCWHHSYEDPGKPSLDHGFWLAIVTSNTPPCKNQPDTKLNWTDTLLKRSDYE